MKNLITKLLGLILTGFISIAGFAQNELFYEDFSDNGIDNWTVMDEFGANWLASNSNEAGGEPPEALLGLIPTFDGISRLVSPVINTSGYTELELSFLQALEGMGSNSEFDIRIETTSDGGQTFNLIEEWHHVGYERYQGDELLEINNSDVGSENFQIAYTFEGLNIDTWLVVFDNVSLLGIPEIPTLCEPLYVDGCEGGKNINDFVLEEIENLGSACEDSKEKGWSQYLELGPANLELGNTYTIQISSEDPYQQLSVWIDFNDDLILTEDERVVTNFSMENGGETYEVEFTIPDDTATLGLHYLRARTNWYFDCLDPCEEFDAGEAEDYYVNIDYATGISIQEEYEASIYPNPANDIVTIKAGSSIDQVLLYNQIGQLVKQVEVKNNTVIINVSDMESGLCFIQIQSATQTTTRKLVIE